MRNNKYTSLPVDVAITHVNIRDKFDPVHSYNYLILMQIPEIVFILRIKKPMSPANTLS